MTETTIVELRQYTMRPGGRDALAELFADHLIEGQQAVGMRVLGLYRDLDRPDRFVWLRGFSDMAARKLALTRFYGESQTWRTHGPAANETMVDSSDVLLLRPLTELRFPIAPRTVATIHPEPANAPQVDAVVRLETEPAHNDFPRLPVRTDGPKLVWFNVFDDEAQQDTYVEKLGLPREWSLRLAPLFD